MMSLHTDREFRHELQDLKDRILLMAGHVEGMITSSIRAVVEHDAELAKRTIEGDRKVNTLEVEIDELCALVLAKRQPMASDLRFIILALKMVTDLERIGDLSVNICERVADLSDPRSVECEKEIMELAGLVRAMLHDVIDAFVERDADKARSVIVRDDEVDELYHQVFRALLQYMTRDPSLIQRGIHIQSIAKWLERIADHSTNLAEQVIFLVKGTDVRHNGKRGGPGPGSSAT